jgi:hemoglobin
VNGSSLYERVGGQLFFDALVDAFYTRVESDALLRPLYPSDLQPSTRHLAMFLAQYWGGPRMYDAERGHPRLRMRHAPFTIGRAERDAWMSHMRAAVESSGANGDDRATLLDYFETASTSLMNQPFWVPTSRGT